MKYPYVSYKIIIPIVLFSFARIALGAFEITEIMYDLDGTDTNREWIEVHNAGTEAADLSKWFFFSANTKHALAPIGASMVPADGYAVITQNVANFQSDWPHYSGLLFDSSWSGLNNVGDTIALKDPALNIVGQTTYTSDQGGAGNGDSLQRLSSTWLGGLPSPGTPNQTPNGGSDDETSPSTTLSAPTKAVTKKEVEIPKTSTNIITKNTVFAGIPFQIRAETFGTSHEPLPRGRFEWSFGDGSTKAEYEHVPFEYTYQYEGEYIISLAYYRAFENKNIEATDRVSIKVIPSSVTISSVGAGSDQYIELDNSSELEVDLSHWIIRGAIQSFVIPNGTIILPKTKLRLSSRVTSLRGADLTTLVLENKNAEPIASYPKKTIVQMSPSSSREVSINTRTDRSLGVVDLNTLGASAANSRLNISRKVMAEVGLILIMLIGIASAFFIKRKKPEDTLDREVKPSDITILE